MHARQRPANTRAAADGMKLHRRSVRLDGREHTVIGLRPGTDARFSTNEFHRTWHVLSDGHGARVLARLLWGLSYQARPGTLLVIDRPFLTPTPFDGDPADPIVIVPSWHTPFTARTARALSRALPLRGPSDGTVRWRTHGLDTALASKERWYDQDVPVGETQRGRVERRNGLISLEPHSAWEMRLWAVQAGHLDPSGPYGDDYTYLGPWRHGHSGEIQVFRDFRRDVTVAKRARADVLSRTDAPPAADDLRPRIWNRCGAIKRGRDMLIENCRNLGPRSAERLALIDVRTLDDLARLGAPEAYRRLVDLRLPGLSRTMLWAMEGALSDTDWRHLPDGRRTELLAQL